MGVAIGVGTCVGLAIGVDVNVAVNVGVNVADVGVGVDKVVKVGEVELELGK